MSRWVARGEGRRVTGHFAIRQPGLADEELPDDHPDIAAFDAGPPDYRAKRRAAILARYGGSFEAAAGDALDMVYRLVKANPGLHLPDEVEAYIAFIDKVKADNPKEK